MVFNASCSLVTAAWAQLGVYRPFSPINSTTDRVASRDRTQLVEAVTVK